MIEPAPTSEPAKPTGLRDLVTQMVWTTYLDIRNDIHVKGSAVAMIALYGYGLFHPEMQVACTELSRYAQGWFVASAMQRK